MFCVCTEIYISFCITKATNTHSKYVVLISMATMVARTPLNVTFIRALPLVKSSFFRKGK